MATDYDAPRKNDDDTESIEAIKERNPDKSAAAVDVDEDHGESLSCPPKKTNLPARNVSSLSTNHCLLRKKENTAKFAWSVLASLLFSQ